MIPVSRSPNWYGIPLRVLLLTFIGTLLCFSIILLLAIFGTVLVAALHGVHPDLRIAYRHIALPAGIGAACIIFLLAAFNEIRHYRQSRALTALERLS